LREILLAQNIKLIIKIHIVYKNCFLQLSGDSGDHPPGSPGGSASILRTTTGTGSTGVRRTASWKGREDQLKREMEERKAVQKQMEEKRQKIAEDRQAARERKQKVFISRLL